MTSAGEGATKILILCWIECKIVQSHWKTLWQFLIKLNIHLPHDLPFLLISIWLRQMDNYPPKDLNANVHGSFIHNCPKLEITQMSIH